MTVSMVYIAPGHWLNPEAAASYRRMRAAGMPAGGITDAGRTYAEQQALYDQYLAGLLLATAARPGESAHETGECLDMKTAHSAHHWMLVHAADHGWSRPLLTARKPEPWHWKHTTSRDRHRDVVTAPPVLITPQETDVKILHDASTNNWYRCGENTIVQLTTAAQVDADRKVWPVVEVDTITVQEQVRRTAAANQDLLERLRTRGANI